MGMRTLEAEILLEAKKVTGKKKLRQKDIVEWSSGDVTVEEGEKHYFLPELRINIAVKE